MNATYQTEVSQAATAATADDIRKIIGPFEDDVVAKIMKVGPTIDEVRCAYAWLRSDEYLQRHLNHNLGERAAEVFAILDEEYPELGDPVL